MGPPGSPRSCPRPGISLAHSPYIHPSVMFRRQVLEEAGATANPPGTWAARITSCFSGCTGRGWRGTTCKRPCWPIGRTGTPTAAGTFPAACGRPPCAGRGFASLGVCRQPLAAWGKPAASGGLPGARGGLLHWVKAPWIAGCPVRWGGILAPALGGLYPVGAGAGAGTGVERLYFLSRDGWYPYRLAKVTLPRPGTLPLDCRYLYGSRYAWRLPLYSPGPCPAAVAQLCGPRRPGPRLRGASSPGRALSPGEPGAAARLRWGCPRSSAALPGPSGGTLGQPELLACPAFPPGRGAPPPARRWRRFLGYLRQEGLLEDGPLGPGGQRLDGLHPGHFGGGTHFAGAAGGARGATTLGCTAPPAGDSGRAFSSSPGAAGHPGGV